MGNTYSLDILSQVEDASTRPPSTINLPIWTPDFSITDTAYQIDQGSSGDLMADAVFHASHGMDAAVPSPRIFGTTLTVSCHKLDTILEAGPEADQRDSCFDDAPVFWLQLCLRLPQICPRTGQNRLEVLWRTIIVDQAEIFTPAPASLARVFYAYCLWKLPRSEHFKGAMAQAAHEGHTLGSWIELDVLADSSPANSIPRFTDVLDFSTQMDEESEIVNMVEVLSDRFSRLHGRVAPARRIFRSSRLNACGMGPLSLQEGDEVVLLHGAGVPFVVRKVDGGSSGSRDVSGCDGTEYRLVGECYVHGFMQGEAFDREHLNAGPSAAEVITLV